MKEHRKELVFVIPAVFVIVLAVIGYQGNIPTFSEVKFPNVDTVQAGNIEEQQTPDQSQAQDTDAAEATENWKETDSSSWQDGTYQGSGKGFGGVITARVTIADQRMTQIDITNHAQETPEYYSRAEVIIPQMIQKQSANVDVVSGATYSSNGIKQAVANALAKAAGKSVQEVSDDGGNENTAGAGEKSQKQASVKGKPADGTYTGSAECEMFGYTLSLRVKFRDAKAVSISNLKISGNQDPANETYWNNAWKPMVKRILQAQNSDVDVVSGATYSSNAIISAYLDAYRQAVAKNDGKKSAKKKSSKATATPKKTPPTLGEDQKSVPVPDQIQDGTYTVTSACDPDSKKAFRSYQLSADITFAGGKLTGITNFTSTDESNRSYYLKAANGSASVTGVVKQLIAKQSASGIQAVSGATCSSKTIRDLYLLALEKAGASVTNTTEDMAVQTPAPKTTPAPSSGVAGSDPGSEEGGTPAKIQDGTYTVSVIVWPDAWEDFREYTMTADVTFADGRYASMDNIQISDTSNQFYCDQAWYGYGSCVGIGQQLQDADRVQYDIVSGATCSAYAFIELYEKARLMATQD